MASTSILDADMLEGVLLDGVYESWKAIEVLHDQNASRWPDLTEARAIDATNKITGLHLKQMQEVIQQYNSKALRPTHRDCQVILKAWDENYAEPDCDHPSSELTTRWMKNTLDTVVGLHHSLFQHTDRSSVTARIIDNDSKVD